MENEVKVEENVTSQPVQEPVQPQAVVQPVEQPKTKRKGRGPLYWIIVIIGVGLIVYLSMGIGEKLGRLAELESGDNQTDTKEESNSNENSNVVDESNSNENSNVMSDEDALKLGQEQWDYAASAMFCGKYTYDDNDVYEGGQAITNFDEVNAHFTSDNLVSSDLANDYTSFKANQEKSFIIKDGKRYDPSGCARGGQITYSFTDLKIVSKSETEIKFTATSSYCSAGGVQKGNNCTGEVTTKDNEFIIRQENGSWKIAKFYLPY